MSHIMGCLVCLLFNLSLRGVGLGIQLSIYGWIRSFAMLYRTDMHPAMDLVNGFWFGSGFGTLNMGLTFLRLSIVLIG